MSPPYQHHVALKDKRYGSERFGHAVSVRHPHMLNNENTDKHSGCPFQHMLLRVLPFVWTAVKILPFC